MSARDGIEQVRVVNVAMPALARQVVADKSDLAGL